jgi:hypothetical protein
MLCGAQFTTLATSGQMRADRGFSRPETIPAVGHLQKMARKIVSNAAGYRPART